eukprot:6690701-Pyramimonas_sp.AAC.1
MRKGKGWKGGGERGEGRWERARRGGGHTRRRPPPPTEAPTLVSQSKTSATLSSTESGSLRGQLGGAST